MLRYSYYFYNTLVKGLCDGIHRLCPDFNHIHMHWGVQLKLVNSSSSLIIYSFSPIPPTHPLKSGDDYEGASPWQHRPVLQLLPGWRRALGRHGVRQRWCTDSHLTEVNVSDGS